ncbi:MAG: hypothetical protein KatS3mg131_0091 [Candidatus Tectimicrobiota bacterium]|nr:MAG: hypothetical protein KatS3mg131_0091 [Candidatus Tectomicrobia bacterium]
MRTLFFLFVLYLIHRLLLLASPAYRERMRRFDRKMAWINLLLVIYLVVNFTLYLLRYLLRE